MPAELASWHTQPQVLRIVAATYNAFRGNERAKYKQTERELAQKYNIGIPSGSLKAHISAVQSLITQGEKLEGFDVIAARNQLIELYPTAATPFAPEYIEAHYPPYRSSSATIRKSVQSAAQSTGMYHPYAGSSSGSSGYTGGSGYGGFGGPVFPPMTPQLAYQSSGVSLTDVQFKALMNALDAIASGVTQIASHVTASPNRFASALQVLQSAEAEEEEDVESHGDESSKASSSVRKTTGKSASAKSHRKRTGEEKGDSERDSKRHKGAGGKGKGKGKKAAAAAKEAIDVEKEDDSEAEEESKSAMALSEEDSPKHVGASAAEPAADTKKGTLGAKKR